MAERIADYCDAVLVIDTLCKSGYKCCVSRDVFGDTPPPELLVIDRTNSSRFDEKNGSKVSPPLTTVRPSTQFPTSISTIVTTVMTTTNQPSTVTRPKPIPLKPCQGECTSGLSALFCDNIDADADCPADGSVLTICCINEPPPTKAVMNHNFQH